MACKSLWFPQNLYSLVGGHKRSLWVKVTAFPRINAGSKLTNGSLCRIADDRVKGFGTPSCRGKADTLKLQSELSNSAAEQTGLRDYMGSKVDCKGVGIVGN